MRNALAFVIVALGLLATPVAAQDKAPDAQTLADIRQEMSVLYVTIQRLKTELSTTTGAPAGPGGDSMLARVDGIEAALTRLTRRTEELEHRIERIVSDGTNRIGDLEFRLVELEGGDVSKLGETTTLGGDSALAGLVAPAPAAGADTGLETGGAELAVGERADFDRANAALDGGDYQVAAEQFALFTETYTGGPLTGEAHFLRGEALSRLGQTSAAARAYWESYFGSPENPRGADALLKLGLSLSQLGQTREACVTLSEVALRFPGGPQVEQAEAERQRLACEP